MPATAPPARAPMNGKAVVSVKRGAAAAGTGLAKRDNDPTGWMPQVAAVR